MKQRLSLSILGVLVFACMMAVSQNSPKAPAQPKALPYTLAENDTIPKREKKMKDLDEALKEIESAMAELEVEMKKPLPPIPPIEMQKVKAEIEKALKDIDPDKIKKEVEMAMKEIDGEKIKMQIEAALSKVDMEKVRKEIEKVRDIELSKIEEELRKVRPLIEESLKDAKINVEKAKAEIEEYKAFENGLENDGLINKKGAYSIEHKDGVLTIDGKKQPEAVYNKYRSFLDKHKNFTWKKDSEGLQINNR